MFMIDTLVGVAADMNSQAASGRGTGDAVHTAYITVGLSPRVKVAHHYFSRYSLVVFDGVHTAIEHILVPLGCRVYRVVYLLLGKTLRARLVHRSHDTFQI